MKTFAAISFLATQALAYPQVLEMLTRDAVNAPEMHQYQKRADNATQAASQAQTNCGPRPCGIFNAKEQFVSNTGDHAFKAPGGSDTRGPCPGLNAAANHGYLPHSGYASIVDTITGLGAAYGMSPDLAGFLAAYAVVMDGDPLTARWSIGGPLDGVNILGKGQGISFSHNKYEGDTSITRPDVYIQGNNKGGVDLNKARDVLASAGSDDRITLDGLRQVSAKHQYESVANNPYYFAPLFSTTLVAPAAHNFVVNFMSNRSAEEPNGYLNKEIFKSFFALTGDGDSLEFHQGQERIPDNWYRRTSTNQYNAVNVFQDLIVGWAAYPNTFRFGGNTNGVNTYRGIDVATLTGGQYSADQLFEGNNFACLVFQAQQQAVPDFAQGLSNLLGPMNAILGKYVNPVAQQFGCPQLGNINKGVFSDFPGASYTGPSP